MIGSKLKELRLRHGLTQQALATKLHVSVRCIKNWESDISDPSLDSVYLRSSQNSQPNSDASDVNSRQERGRVFRIARSDPPPAF